MDARAPGLLLRRDVHPLRAQPAVEVLQRVVDLRAHERDLGDEALDRGLPEVTFQRASSSGSPSASSRRSAFSCALRHSTGRVRPASNVERRRLTTSAGEPRVDDRVARARAVMALGYGRASDEVEKAAQIRDHRGCPSLPARRGDRCRRASGPPGAGRPRGCRRRAGPRRRGPRCRRRTAPRPVPPRRLGERRRRRSGDAACGRRPRPTRRGRRSAAVSPASSIASRRSQSQFEQTTRRRPRARRLVQHVGRLVVAPRSTRVAFPARSFSRITSYSPGCTSVSASIASVRPLPRHVVVTALRVLVVLDPVDAVVVQPLVRVAVELVPVLGEHLVGRHPARRPCDRAVEVEQHRLSSSSLAIGSSA